MTCWSCIEGMNDETWVYVPLGVVEDLKRIPEAVNALFPTLETDDTAWTRAISGSRRLMVMREERDSAVSPAA
jgi:hypothetical protein